MNWIEILCGWKWLQTTQIIPIIFECNLVIWNWLLWMVMVQKIEWLDCNVFYYYIQLHTRCECVFVSITGSFSFLSTSLARSVYRWVWIIDFSYELHCITWVNSDCMHIVFNVYGWNCDTKMQRINLEQCIGLNWHSASFIMHNFGIYSIIFMITTCTSINTLYVFLIVVVVVGDGVCCKWHMSCRWMTSLRVRCIWILENL